MVYKREEEPNFLRGKLKMVQDDLLIHREIYNPNSFGIKWVRTVEKDQYVAQNGIPLGPQVIIQNPETFVHLNHAYYVGYAMNGAPEFNVTINYGNSIGKGNKHASRPD
jgi:hypothetical protein